MPRKKRKWHSAEDDDPGAGLLNLFDVWIAFAVALLLAMVSYFNLSEMMDKSSTVTVIKNAGTPKMEIVRKDGVKVERFRVSKDSIGGDGERLGTAYRLKTGEVIYVPETKIKED